MNKYVRFSSEVIEAIQLTKENIIEFCDLIVGTYCNGMVFTTTDDPQMVEFGTWFVKHECWRGLVDSETFMENYKEVTNG